MAPTPEGADDLQRVERILGEVEAAAEAVRGAQARPRGRLRIDVPTAFGRLLLVPALPGFLARYPDLDMLGNVVERGRLETVLDEWSAAGPPASVISPESVRRTARVRVFADFAAGLLLRWREALASGRGPGRRE
ncbi:MAG: hypothetical protein O9284_14625 [Steroidobacteraceae bacterium]|nr:hypothetical protein [Steroidobacteraceae bacterium]